MPSFPLELWLLLAGVGGFGIVAILYGASCVLHHELSRIRLERKARDVYDAYLRRLDAIARGEAMPSSLGEVVVVEDDEPANLAA